MRRRPTRSGRDAADDAAPDPRDEVERWVDQDPAFSIGTVDGIAWIDPFTGTAIAAPFGFRDVAIAHLLQTQPWKKKLKPQSVAALLVLRWTKHLNDAVPIEPRLRTFDGEGTWLNAYTGDWEPTVRVHDGKINLDTLQAMASAIARRVGLRLPPLLPRVEIDHIVFAANRGSASARAGSDVLRAVRAPVVMPHTQVALVPKDGVAPKPPTGGPVGATAKAPTAEEAVAAEQTVALRRARTVMDRLLRPVPKIPGIDIAVEFHPHELVGGDFYEFIQLTDGRWFMALGDVSGHGPGAALVVTSALKTLRYIVPESDDVRAILTRLNDDIGADLPVGFFISVFAAIIDPDDASLHCVCAGHHPALVVNGDDEIVMRRVGLSGAAVGPLTAAAFAASLHESTYQLRRGDRFIMYTDGMFEVEDAKNVHFGELRTMASAVATNEATPAGQAQAMVGAVKRHAVGRLPDDATVVILARGSNQP